jgi:hypothetical protein
MAKLTNTRRAAVLSLTAVAIIALILIGEIEVAAQDKQLFKTGDRVAVLYPGTQDVRYKGKVVSVERGGECYAIAVDGENTSPTTFCTRYAPIVRLGKNDEPVVNNKGAADNPAPRPEKGTAEGGDKRTEDKKAGGFQPGDRVEVLVGNEWRKATVVANEVDKNKSYVVKRDDDPLRERRMALSTVRALQDPGGDDGGKKIAASAQQSVQRAIERCSGEPLVNLRTKGRSASAGLFSEVIRANSDRQASNSDHKKVTKIDKITVGSPFKRGAITFYPANVDLTTCEDGLFNWSMSVARNYDYVCYVNPARSGEWSCDIYRSTSPESVIVPKPEANRLRK